MNNQYIDPFIGLIKSTFQLYPVEKGIQKLINFYRTRNFNELKVDEKSRFDNNSIRTKAKQIDDYVDLFLKNNISVDEIISAIDPLLREYLKVLKKSSRIEGEVSILEDPDKKNKELEIEMKILKIKEKIKQIKFAKSIIFSTIFLSILAVSVIMSH